MSFSMAKLRYFDIFCFFLFVVVCLYCCHWNTQILTLCICWVFRLWSENQWRWSCRRWWFMNVRAKRQVLISYTRRKNRQEEDGWFMQNPRGFFLLSSLHHKFLLFCISVVVVILLLLFASSQRIASLSDWIVRERNALTSFVIALRGSKRNGRCPWPEHTPPTANHL